MRVIRQHNNLQFYHEASCAPESTAAAPQFAKSQLKTQKEGHEASDIATDVRKSHEVEKEHQDGYGNSGTTTQREDESVK